MFDLIPTKLYGNIYLISCLIIVLLTLFISHNLKIESKISQKLVNSFGVFMFFFVILYLGMRPIDNIFVDMKTYAKIFENYAHGRPMKDSKDILFHSFIWGSSKLMKVELFFFLCELIYVLPLFYVCKKIFKQGWSYAFLFLICSFSFYAYGTNTIRNGMAGSIFLIAMAVDKRWIKYFLLFLAFNMHGSMALPIAAYILTIFYKNPRVYLFAWLLAIPLSLMFAGFWEALFASLVEDDRASYLTKEADANVFSRTGFRWDFLLFSAVPIAAGFYYTIVKKFEDATYNQLFCIYIICNAFWILVIRANFSDRFAYLSWFMMALIIVYPLLKNHLFQHQNRVIGLFLFLYFSFTFFMNFKF